MLVVRASRVRQFILQIRKPLVGRLQNVGVLRRRRERDGNCGRKGSKVYKPAWSFWHLYLCEYLCDVHSLKLLNRLARRREYDRRRRAAITPEQQQQRERRRLRQQEIETDKERQSRLTANSVKC